MIVIAETSCLVKNNISVKVSVIIDFDNKDDGSGSICRIYGKNLDPWRWAVGQLLGSWQLFYCPEGNSVVYQPHVEKSEKRCTKIVNN